MTDNLNMPDLDRSRQPTGPRTAQPLRWLLVLLQYCHLVLLVALPIGYAFFVSFSEDHDKFRRVATVGMAVLAAAWSGLVVVSTAVFGEGESIRKRLIDAYRKFLLRRSFLWVSNTVMMCAFAVLLYLIFGFRQIEFYAEQPAILLSAASSQPMSELGFLAPKSPSKFRLPVGMQRIVFQDPTTKATLLSEPLSVLPIWRVWDIERIPLKTQAPPPPEDSVLVINFSNASPGVPVLRGPKSYGGRPLFFEAFKSDVTLSHNQLGQKPLRVVRLALAAESVPADASETAKLSYDIDVLNQKPHGIVELNRYLFSLRTGSTDVRLLKGLKPRDAIQLNSQNLLETNQQTQAIEINPTGNDAHYQIAAIVHAQAAGLYRVQFVADYDIAGASKTARTAWIYLFRK